MTVRVYYSKTKCQCFGFLAIVEMSKSNCPKILTIGQFDRNFAQFSIIRKLHSRFLAFGRFRDFTVIFKVKVLSFGFMKEKMQVVVSSRNCHLAFEAPRTRACYVEHGWTSRGLVRDLVEREEGGPSVESTTISRTGTLESEVWASGPWKGSVEQRVSTALAGWRTEHLTKSFPMPSE